MGQEGAGVGVIFSGSRPMYGKKNFGIKTLIFVSIVSVLAGIILTAGMDMTGPTDAQNFWKESSGGEAKVEPRRGGFSELAKKLSPTVVNISTTQSIKERPFAPLPDFKSPFDEFFDDFDRFFNEPQREFKRQSLGSGFMINKEGYILTNQHVIENATEILVTLSDNKRDYKAEVVGEDKKLDIALIKIDAKTDLPVAALGDSDELEIGEWVLAIGNPFGLGGTVTAGIVSQKARFIGSGPYDNFIQTDASINPGNSGGPLFNMKGEVVGINTAIVAGGQGIGFASPINMVKEVLVQLKDYGKVTRGWIGVSIQELTPELARSFELKEAKGVLVSSVNPGDPADLAGIRAGDIVVSFNGKPVEGINDLPRVVAVTAPGKKVEVALLRDGKKTTLFVTVGTMKDGEAMVAEVPGEEGTPDTKMGLNVQDLTPELARRLGVDEAGGIFISNVRPDSPAEDAGLRRGDVIIEINRRPVKDMADYRTAIEEAQKERDVLFLIKRGANIIYVVMELEQ